MVAGLFVLSLITYIDRAAISSAKEPLGVELGLSDAQMGAVFSAFALGYAIAQVPSGWIADTWGPRLMLTLVVAVWSIFTWATGVIQSLWALLAVRFLFGIAEAGAFPGCARAFYNWLPRAEHGRANGIIFSGSRIGAAIAFPVMAWLLGTWGWRTAFYLLAIPGFLWALLWFALFRNHPRTPPPQDEAATGPAMTFGEVFRSRRMLLAMAQYFATNFTTFLCLSWMHPYLKQRYQLSAADAAFYAMIPLLVGAGAQWATGFLVDRLYRSRYRVWSRRAPAMLGFAISASGLILIPTAATAAAAAACFTLAAFGAEMTISPSWAFCIDIGGSKSGAVAGAMNMLGNFGSFVSANVFPLVEQWTGSADAYFYLVCAMSICAALCWTGMRSLRERVEVAQQFSVSRESGSVQ